MIRRVCGLEQLLQTLRECSFEGRDKSASGSSAEPILSFAAYDQDPRGDAFLHIFFIPEGQNSADGKAGRNDRIYDGIPVRPAAASYRGLIVRSVGKDEQRGILLGRGGIELFAHLFQPRLIFVLGCRRVLPIVLRNGGELLFGRHGLIEQLRVNVL